MIQMSLSVTWNTRIYQHPQPICHNNEKHQQEQQQYEHTKRIHDSFDITCCIENVYYNVFTSSL